MSSQEHRLLLESEEVKIFSAPINPDSSLLAIIKSFADNFSVSSITPICNVKTVPSNFIPLNLLKEADGITILLFIIALLYFATSISLYPGAANVGLTAPK